MNFDVFKKNSDEEDIFRLKSLNSLNSYQPCTSFIPRFMSCLHIPRNHIDGVVYQKNLFFGDNKTTLSIFSPDGIPCGVMPRRILSFIAKEAVQKKSHIIQLGESQNDFLRYMGAHSTGGKRGYITSIKEQLKRLLGSTISIKSENKISWQIENTSISHKSTILWEKSGVKNKWEGNLILSQDFFQELIAHPVPVDFNVLKILQSSLSIDIYCWLIWKRFCLKQKKQKEIQISWTALFQQFSGEYKDDINGRKNFKKNFIKMLDLSLKHIGVSYLKKPTYLIFFFS